MMKKIKSFQQERVAKMNKIYPCLWFDQQAEEAAEYYVSLFNDSGINNKAYYVDDVHREKGSLLTVDLTLAGQRFMTLNGGPEFSFTPAVSFFVDCETKEEVERLWEAFMDGGQALMPLQEYPFSDYFGWIQDRYGVSWQLSLSHIPQRISTAVMFANEKLGQAKPAMDQWVSLFENSQVLAEFPVGELLQQGLFTLEDSLFRVMDSPEKHPFGFTMAISFCVACADQAEIDFLWEHLTKDGKEWPCGWAEDAYGLYWQIAPGDWGDLMDRSNPERAEAVAKEMYTMKKIDIAQLQAVYNQFK